MATKYYYTAKIFLWDILLLCGYFAIFGWFKSHHHEFDFKEVLVQSVFFTITMRLMTYWSYKKTKKSKTTANQLK